MLVVVLSGCSNYNRDEVYVCNGISPAYAIEEKLRLDFAIQGNEVVVGLMVYPITSEDEYTITAKDTINEYSYVKFDKSDETLLDKQTNVVTNTDYHTIYQCRKLY